MARNRKAFFGGLRFSQQGAVLILMAFILGLGTVVYLLKAFDAASLQAKQDAKTYQTLKEAKAALIAWAVNHPNTPGLMPYPDRNGDGNYDNTSDCYASNVSFNTQFTLGRLPLFQNDPNCITHDTIDLSGVHDVSAASGLGEDFRDGAGERLWYEVSSNLLHDYKSTGPHSNGTSPVINPDIVNNPSYPWFVVRDRNGVVISNRVAAVIISAGAPVGAQDRSSGIADANQYLDKIVMADGTPYKNYGYQVLGVTPVQEFIIGDDLRLVAKSDPTYKNQSIEPYYYNDKLVYITIDELMAALSRRVAAEAKVQLVNYKSATATSSPPGYYPYASAMVSVEYYQKSNQYTGFLPIQQPVQTSPKSCSVTYANVNSSSAVCDFSSITNVEFTRTSGTFTSVTGTGCSRINSNKTCSCAITSGSSRCNGSSGRRFTCTTSGCSTAGTLPGSYVFKGVFSFTTSPKNVKANSFSGACSGCGDNTNTATCAYTATTPSGSFSYSVTTTPAAFNSATTSSVLPAWFIANSWQDYLFYAVSSNCTYGQLCNAPDINVGSKSSIQAMIAATGAPIVSVPFAVKGSAQSHSGCDVKEYLDSTENTNLDVKFEANNKLKASNYNDQTFVVAP